MMASPSRPFQRVSAQTVSSKVAARTESSKNSVTEAGITGCGGGGASISRGRVTWLQAVVAHKAAASMAAIGVATVRVNIRIRYLIE